MAPTGPATAVTGRPTTVTTVVSVRPFNRDDRGSGRPPFNRDDRPGGGSVVRTVTVTRRVVSTVRVPTAVSARRSTVMTVPVVIGVVVLRSTVMTVGSVVVLRSIVTIVPVGSVVRTVIVTRRVVSTVRVPTVVSAGRSTVMTVRVVISVVGRPFNRDDRGSGRPRSTVMIVRWRLPGRPSVTVRPSIVMIVPVGSVVRTVIVTRRVVSTVRVPTVVSVGRSTVTTVRCVASGIGVVVLRSIVTIVRWGASFVR